MGDTSTELEKELGSGLDPNPTDLSEAKGSPKSNINDNQNTPRDDNQVEDAGTDNLDNARADEQDQLEAQLSKLETSSKALSPSSLHNRFDIYPNNPLPEFDSPSARAFKAEDRMQPKLQLFGLICIPGLPVRLSEVEKISGKALPGNLNLVSFGNIDWPILGQKCLVLIFKCPLGGRVDHFFKAKDVPKKKKVETANLIAKTGISSLLSLRERRLTNRNIRPNNIFFTDTDQEEIIFGEFVTSPPGFDQSLEYETIERGMAGQGGRGQGSLDDDIYALGATLALLIQERNPIRGKSPEQIIFSKIALTSFKTLVGEKLLTRNLMAPIRGMLQDNKTERWSFEELDTWLRGHHVKPIKNVLVNKSRRSFRFGGVDHKISRALGFSMSTHRESALNIIKDGSLEEWIEEGLQDILLADAIKVAKENAAAFTEAIPHADELLLSRVLMLMDPKGPITYKDISYMPDGFGSAMAIESLREGNTSIYIESIVNGVPDIWYTISNESNPYQHTELESYAKMASHLQKAGPGFGIERCLYEANPGCACQSPIIVKENIYSVSDLLQTLNSVQKLVDTKQSPIDRHIAAFIASRSSDNMDESVSKLGDLDDAMATLSMLRLLVDLQNTMNIGTLLGLAKWVGGLMGPVIRLYHSRGKRKEIESAVPSIVRSGNLSELLSLLDNPTEKQEDEKNYLAAVKEYSETEDEIEEIRNNIGPESESGERTSKQAASVISGLIMIVIIFLIMIT